MLTKAVLLTILTTIVLSSFCTAQNADRGRFMFIAVLPTAENDQLVQPMSYELLATQKASVKIHLKTLYFTGNDSIIVYDILFKDVSLKNGANNLDITFDRADHVEKLDKDFADIIKKIGVTPVGAYKLLCDVISDDSSINYSNYFLYYRDSTLTKGSGLRNKINDLFADPAGTVAGSVKDKISKSDNGLSKEEIKRTNNKLDKKVARLSGVSTNPVVVGGRVYSEMYYKGWFLGRYELATAGELKSKATSEASEIKNSVTSAVSNNIEDLTSIRNQIKELFKQNKDEDKMSATFDLNTCFSTGQEPNSAQDNNYTELHGEVSKKVMDVPISIEGYYTTQDRHRQAKASYIRIHYDVEKAKSELSQQINSYKNKFNQTASKGKGLEVVYNNYLEKLSNEKQQLLDDTKKEYGIDETRIKGSSGNIDELIRDNVDTTGLTKQLADSAVTKTGTDSSAKKAKESLANKKIKLQKRYDQLVTLQEKIEKYSKLLNQYKQQLYLDSAATYSKIEQLSKGDEASYKQMAKAAADILPDGKAKRFVTGLTNLDAGILNKYESSYTMAGQNLKGVSVGYDLGFTQLGITVGSTEYVSRDGNVDKYTSYLAKLKFKAFKGQKVSLIYYGYTPGTKMLAEDKFFKDIDVALPSFREPVHIISLDYEGKAGKNALICTEGATSFRKSDKEFFSLDKTAIKTGVDYSIRRAKATLKAEWEHMGRDFENSALPVIRSATERYTLGTQVDLFRSFLTVGVQYNYLMQQSFSTTGYSTKWGFDIKTHSKRYPSVQLSYKPFSTFRTYSDTLAIEQRPLTGDVWTGKASYQVKKLKRSQRFVALYSQTASGMDSMSYNSKMFQVGYILTTPGQMMGINAGWMSMPVGTTANMNGMEGYSNTSNYFLNTSINKTLTKHTDVTAAVDMAVAKYGLQKAGLMVGCNYRWRKLPLTVRLMGRYSNYKPTAADAYKALYGGQIGLGWQFSASRSLIKKKE